MGLGHPTSLALKPVYPVLGLTITKYQININNLYKGTIIEKINLGKKTEEIGLAAKILH